MVYKPGLVRWRLGGSLFVERSAPHPRATLATSLLAGRLAVRTATDGVTVIRPAACGERDGATVLDHESDGDADISRHFAPIAAIVLVRGRRQRYECPCDAVDVVCTLARSRTAESGPNEVSLPAI